jgi:hypothetical protein
MPKLTSSTLAHGSWACEKAISDSQIAIITPAIELHNPNRTNKPAAEAITCGAMVRSDAPFLSS